MRHASPAAWPCAASHRVAGHPERPVPHEVDVDVHRLAVGQVQAGGQLLDLERDGAVLTGCSVLAERAEDGAVGALVRPVEEQLQGVHRDWSLP